MGNKWSFSYEVAKPNEFVVLTGVGIRTVKIRKALLKLPGQVANRMDIMPQNYEFAIQAMSAEKLVFQLPGVMTIGPNIEVGGSLEEGSANYINMQRFSTFFGDSPIELQIKTIKGMIEGEMRGACASMTLEEIFKDRTLFKKRVTDAIQQELDQFGLQIKSSNIRELEDTQGSEYFSYLRQKTRSGAENDAKIAIADANNRGTVGQTDREANTRVNTAIINARAIIAENEQRTKILDSNTSLQLNMIQYETKIKLQQTEQVQTIQKTELEQSRIVEEVRQGKRLEELRAKQGVDASIQAEIVQKQVDAQYYQTVKLADAQLYEKNQEAEGIKVIADARKKALAEYTKVLKEPNALLNYIMLERGLFQQMAEINSDAIQGLNPNITVWNTGGSGDAGVNGQSTDPYGPIRNIFSAVPPLYTMVQEQTGIAPPSRK